MKKTYLLLLILLVLGRGYAQNTLNFCKDNVYNNFPATASENFNAHFSLPMLSNIEFHFSQNAFPFGNIFQLADDTQKGKDVALKSGKINKANASLNFEVVGFGFRIKNNYFSFSNKMRSEGYGVCPGDVAKLLINGISPYTGKNLNGSIELSGTVYNETAIGYQRKINDMFSIGGRVKLLIGVTNFTSKTSDINFCYNEDGTLFFTNNFSMRRSAPDFAVENNDPNSKFSVSDIKNYGGGIDLGFNVTFPFGLEIRTGLLDLGWIRWKSDAYYFDVRHNKNFSGYENGKIAIHGFELSEHKLNIQMVGLYPEKDSASYGLWKFKDSDEIFKNAFIVKNGFKSYTTMTYPKIFLETSYNISMHKFAFLARIDIVQKRVFPLFTFGYGLNVRKVMDVAVSYSLAKGYYANLGVALAFNIMDVFHLYVATDNILAPLCAIKPVRTDNYYGIKNNFMNIQTGIYFTLPQFYKKVTNTSLMRSN